MTGVQTCALPILYAFTSGAANNGSAFAGLNANTTFYNLGIGLNILFGRYIYIVAALVIAGAASRMLDGVTGDTFGASIEVAQAAVLQPAARERSRRACPCPLRNPAPPA